MSRVAVVTGGASGIGLGISNHLAASGHRVAVLDINGDAAESTADDLQKNGAKAMAAKVDVSDRADIDDALGRVRSAFGPIEIMVTSAAIADFVPFTDITAEQWDRMIGIDLTGTFHCVQAALPDMITAQWGRVITIASSAGQIGSVRQGHYAAAKAGVIAMTKTVAREYGKDGITANSLPPFFADTPMSQAARGTGNLPSLEALTAPIPAGRPGSIDDFGATCAFLCSDGASYINGQVIGVNGGALV